jgi:hypothetical protein
MGVLCLLSGPACRVYTTRGLVFLEAIDGVVIMHGHACGCFA